MHLKRFFQVNLLFFVFCWQLIDVVTATDGCTRNEDCRRVRGDDHVCVHQTCMKPSEYSKPCIEDNQCRHHLVPDTDDATSSKVLIRCINSLCSCQEEGHQLIVDDEGPSCKPGGGGKKFGEECKLTEICSEENVSCIRGTCSCNIDSVRFDDICHLKKHVGEECNDARECVDEGASCKGKRGSFTCQCESGYKENEKSCIKTETEQKDEKPTNWVLIGSIFGGTLAIAVVSALVVLWFCNRR